MARNPCDAGCYVTRLPQMMEDDMTQPVSVTMRQSQRARSHQSIPGKRYSEPLTNAANANDVVRLLHTVLLAHALSLRKQLAQPSEKLFRERLLQIHYDQRIQHNIGFSVIKKAAITLPNVEVNQPLFFHTPVVNNYLRFHIERASPKDPAKTHPPDPGINPRCPFPVSVSMFNSVQKYSILVQNSALVRAKGVDKPKSMRIFVQLSLRVRT